MQASLDAVLPLASGLALAAFGGALLLLRPRGSDQAFFGLFTVLWGAQVASANLGALTRDPRVHALGLTASFALMPAATLFLARFAVRALPRRGALVLTALAGLSAAGAALALALAPRMVLDSVVEAAPGGLKTTYGPLALPLFHAPFLLAFCVALAAQHRQHLRAPPGPTRAQARVMLLALGVFLAYWPLRNLLLFSKLPLDLRVSGDAIGFQALYGACALVVLVVFAWHARVVRGHHRAAAVGAFLLATLGAYAEHAGVVPYSAGPGAWRLATVAGLVYAIGRYQAFDVEAQLVRGVGSMLALLAAGAGLVVAAFAWTSGSARMAPLALGAGGAGAWALRSLGETAAARLLPAPRADAQAQERKLEVYRFRLERAVAAPARADEEDLARLRRDLGLTPREHALMEYMVRRAAAEQALGGERRAIEPGALLLGRYRILEPLGEGGQGSAHLCVDEATRERVVVKRVRADPGGRAILREAKLLAAVRHPNVVALRDVIAAHDLCFLVMEHAPGGSLAGLLRRKGPLPPEEAADVARQVLEGLEAVHAQGLAHLDVKPENVLLFPEGVAKLADFGVARRVGEDATAAEGVAVGTLLAMSPEQVRGMGVDQRTDVYAVGALLHRLLTGRPYLDVRGLDDFLVRRAILHEPPDLGGVEPRAMAEVVRRALEKDPESRFPDARSMRLALAEEARQVAA